MNKRSRRSPQDRSPPPVRRGLWPFFVVGILITAGGGLLFADWWTVLPDEATASYVGRQNCIACHTQEAAAWEGSHHDLAMDPATPETVLGDFNNAEFTHHGITSRMYRDGDQFMIHTEGPTGAMEDFEIKYVFGVDPLQQYMVEFDREGLKDDEVGRVQVLRISWDTRQKRWFYLPPPDVEEKLEPNDDLHWTGIAQRWNTMCADCHSTNLKKNFDTRTKQYHTTFSEIDVSCEACHGPGSVHVELASSRSLFWDRKRGYGLAKLKTESNQAEIEACAPCHSRRRVVHPDFDAGDSYFDHYANELLQEHTYHADGQIMDEVYVYGSYVQSKMFHKDIRCSDCHDPHTARLKHEGNRVCTSCHQHPAGKYDTPAHHRHDMKGAGASCADCHMPETTYMEVDPRRDHSMRVPRPDLSVLAQTPNACSGCHLEKSELSEQRRGELGEYSQWILAAREGDEEVAAALAKVDRWAADQFESWYGKKSDLDGHPAIAWQAARRGDDGIDKTLISIARDRRNSAIVRATTLLELGRYGTDEALDLAQRLLDDVDPQVRATAVGNLQTLPPDALVEQAVPLLHDPVRVVRTEAARVLARVPRDQIPGPERQRLLKSLGELQAALMATNDRASAHLTLGILFEDLGDVDNARRSYQTAIHVEPNVTGPRTNLAALFDGLAQQAGQQAGQQMQYDRAGAGRLIDQASKYAAEAKRLRREELDLLARDARLAPESAPIQYRYGLSLYLHDRLEEAETALVRATELEPNTADFTLALALFYQKQRRLPEARELVDRLLEEEPDNQMYQNLRREL